MDVGDEGGYLEGEYGAVGCKWDGGSIRLLSLLTPFAV